MKNRGKETMKLLKLQILRPIQKKRLNLTLLISWSITILAVFGMLGFVIFQWLGLSINVKKTSSGSGNQFGKQGSQMFSLPKFSNEASLNSIQRRVNLKTDTGAIVRHEVIVYTIEKGDSIFKISEEFNIKPETILWANSESLNDNPELLTIGMKLKIPPTDGIYYKWRDGDTIADVAAKYKVDPSAILFWPENQLDKDDTTILPDTYVMVPGGKREMVSWVMPTIPRKNSGATKNLAGPGACETTDGAYGTGTFIWPAVNDYLSGNDYWSGHLALDIASGLDSPVYASDSGLVVYAGWNNSGYGYMVMIDHGNGYQTLYAHLSQVSVTCGSSVYQGLPIGSSGSTGNSTGPHLHFETRYMGGLVNPWSLLP
ncbi:MAG: M23 family metallopeptidase [Anaerolineae bacterium]|nr:M23 family metallopeptidase [Anaerolineae bacterium]